MRFSLTNLPSTNNITITNTIMKNQKRGFWVQESKIETTAFRGENYIVWAKDKDTSAVEIFKESKPWLLKRPVFPIRSQTFLIMDKPSNNGLTDFLQKAYQDGLITFDDVVAIAQYVFASPALTKWPKE